MATRPVLKTFLLNDGHRIPIIGFGTGTALYGQNATASTLQAIREGFTHLDGAQAYNNEDSLGEAIATHIRSGAPRSDLFVTTKLRPLPEGESVRDSLKASLARLKLDYVDLFLIHSPTNHKKEHLPDIWAQFEAVKQEGLAKSIGVSNFLVKDFEVILPTAKVIPAVNQLEYHPYLVKYTQETLDLHKKHNIHGASYGGFSSLFRRKGGPVDPVIATIRERLEKTWGGKPVTDGQVLLKWLYAKDIIAITTSNKQSRLQELLASQDVPELTPEEVKAIDDAGSPVHHRVFWANKMD